MLLVFFFLHKSGEAGTQWSRYVLDYTAETWEKPYKVKTTKKKVKTYQSTQDVVLVRSCQQRLGGCRMGLRDGRSLIYSGPEAWETSAARHRWDFICRYK